MKRNVWIINHYATEMFRNGGGRHHWFAKELLNAGYNPIIICSNVFYTTSTESIDIGPEGYRIMEKDGVRYVMVKTSTYSRNDIKRVKNILDFYINVRRFAGRISQLERPDIIIGSSVHPLACVAGIKLAKKYNIPCISEIRDLWPEELIRDDGLNEKGFTARLLFGLEHWIYTNSDAVVFTQEGGKDYIKDRGWTSLQGGDIDLNKVFYINNGVDLRTYYENLNEHTIHDEDLEDEEIFKVVYTGAIRKTNGIERLVDIGKQLSDYKNIKILIWGDGDQVEGIKKQITEQNIKNVVYKGRVEKKYIPFILSRSNINILNYVSGNSFYYGCSNNKLFEYLAAGKPIICTVKMNYSIINKYRCGVELESNEEIVKQIVDYYQGSDVESICDNAKAAAKEFDFRTHTQKLISIIEQI